MLTPTANALLPIPFSGRKALVVPCHLDPQHEIARLTRGLVEGDDEAFRQFHALYFDRLYQFLMVVSRGQEDEAKEALQQTLLRVVRYVRVFNSDEELWSWLKVLGRCAARDAGRKSQRYAALLRDFAGSSSASTSSKEADPEPRLNALVQDALEQLEPGDRRLVEGKYFRGESVRELAVQSGLTEKAIESRLLRLRRHLREGLLHRLRNR